MLNKIFKSVFEALPENNELERIWILAKTDFKKRYYGSALGIVWALINPLVQLLIFYYVFTVFFKTDIPNFPLYIFLGLILWMFFAESSKKGLLLIHTKRYLIENIRINKYDIFTSASLSNIFALLFNLLVFFAISFFFEISYSLNLLYLPLLLLNLIILVYGLNLILSVVFIYLRDFEHFWDIFLMAAFWVNPIVYSDEVLYKTGQIYLLNPIAGIITNAHHVVLNEQSMDISLFLYDYAYALVILLLGVIVFNFKSKKVVEIL